jgi:D-alanyl-D-alanine carboxypeptidase
MSHRGIAAAGFLVAFLCHVEARQAMPPGGAGILGRAPEIRRQLDEFYATRKAEGEKFYDAEDPRGGAVLVAVGEEVIYTRGLGLANREWNIPATTDTKFEIWSVTKTFTAVAILQLQERGKLRIDDKMCGYLKKYLPNCPRQWQAITIRHLLAHTAGLDGLHKDKSGLGFFNAGELFCQLCRTKTTPKEVLDLYGDEPLHFEPGTHSSYSNFGYYLLGLVIEQASGKSYEEALREQIFLPSRMANTGLNRSELILPKRAGKYLGDPVAEEKYFACEESIACRDKGQRKVPLINGEYDDPSWIFSAGALYSTVEDLCNYGRALLAGKLLNTGTRELMWTAVSVPYYLPPKSSPQVIASVKGKRAEYGLGWETRPVAGRRCFHHMGAGRSTGGMFTLCPDENLIVAELGYHTVDPRIFNIIFGENQKSARHAAAASQGE